MINGSERGMARKPIKITFFTKNQEIGTLYYTHMCLKNVNKRNSIKSRFRKFSLKTNAEH